MSWKRSLFTVVLLVVALSGGPALAQAKYGPGASDKEIKIGNTNPYSGPASAYGTIGRGIEAFFRWVNEEGGVNGRKVNLITYDDGYSPPRTVEQVRRLVERDQVLLLFQTLGTPSNTAIHAYANARKVPHLFIASGASKWGQPDKFPWSMGWQPTYPTESTVYARHIMTTLAKELGQVKVGILYQNDDYGKDYLDGFLAALGDRAKELVVASLPYEVTDPTVDSQIAQLHASGANVFFNITTPKFAAQAIRRAHDIGWRPVHFLNNVSISVGSVLKPAGLERSVGLISGGYLKDPTDPQWRNDADVKAWSAWMDKYYPQGDKADVFNAYAYAVSHTLLHVLRQAGDDLTRENIMKVAANLKDLEVPLLLPGIKINTGPKDFYPIEAMRLQRFNGEVWEFFGDVIDVSRR